MATVTKWSGVSVALQSAAAATVTITAITKANPGVASATNTYTNGDYVLILAQGMDQINNRVVRVSAVSGSAFSLEGVDTTLYNTFSSGTASKLTFGTTVSTFTTISNSGGGFDFIDVTTISDTIKKQVPGTSNAIAFTFESLWDPADAGQIAMKAASDAQSSLAFRFTFGTGGKIFVFYGNVGFSGAPGGSAQGVVTCQATITAFGTPTYYAS